MQAFHSRAKMRRQWEELDARREMRRAEKDIAAQNEYAAETLFPGEAEADVIVIGEEMPDYAAQNIRLDKPADAVRLPAGMFVSTITGRNYKPVTPERWQEAMDALSGPWGRV